MRRAALDPVAALAAVLGLAMLLVYVVLMRAQGDRPLVWVLTALLVASVSAGYGAATGSPHRRAALLGAGLVFVTLGILAILSIGLPILVAGALCLFSVARRTRARTV
jgi:4-hydroxybenzoate polyprenyltransferase